MLPLRLACWDYDRTRPLVDGRVQPEGIKLDVSFMRPREAFVRMLQDEAFDIAEVSLASFVKLVANDDERFVGLPVPLSRMFRHSCIYVRTDSGIAAPQDLIGRRVGVTQLDSTGIVFIKGMLKHDYGVEASSVRWTLGGLEAPAALPPPHLPGHGDVAIETDETLNALLIGGRIDAIISNHIPSSFLAGHPMVRRLFPDYKRVEMDYVERTSIFPIMHLVVVRRAIFAADPWILDTLFAAFDRSRAIAVDGLFDTDALRLTLPWLIDHVEEARRALGASYWSYGIEESRPAWSAIGHYMHEQQLATRRVTPEALFREVLSRKACAAVRSP